MEYRERCIATGDGIAFQDEPDTSTNLHIGPDHAQPALVSTSHDANSLSLSIL
jgi:hypothetical protein